MHKQELRQKVLTVAFYERVSGHRQEKEATIETQDFCLGRWAEEQGYHHYETYRDQNVRYRTPLPERPAFQRLYEDAKARRFQAVVCYDYERWSRDEYIYLKGEQLLRSAGVRLICLGYTPDFSNPEGKIQAKVMLGIVEYAQEMQNQSMQHGRERRAYANGFPGGIVTYGYTIVPDPKDPKGKTWALHDKHAAVVRRMYEETVNERRSCFEIARRLNEEGVPTPEPGSKWRHSTVAKLLKKTMYKGYKLHGPKKIRIEVPPVVSEALWEHAQAMLALNRRLSKRNARREYLLSGKLHCPVCRRTLQGRTYARPSGDYLLYCCPGQQEYWADLAPAPCPLRTFKGRPLEEWAWARVQALLLDHEGTQQRIVAEQATEDREKERLTKVRQRLTEERHRWTKQRDAAANGVSVLGFELDRTDAEALYHEAKDELTHLNDQLDQVNAALEATRVQDRRLTELKHHLGYWHKVVKADHPERLKRHLIQLFLKQIEVTRDDEGLRFRVTWSFDPTGREPDELSGRKGGLVSIENPLSGRWR